MTPALRFPISEKRPVVIPNHRVPHKALKKATLEIRAAAMRSPILRGDLTLTARLKIAQRLLVLQRRQLLRVFVDGEQVSIAHFAPNESKPMRRWITWQDAAEIADNPDKNLARYLRGLA